MNYSIPMQLFFLVEIVCSLLIFSYLQSNLLQAQAKTNTWRFDMGNCKDLHSDWKQVTPESEYSSLRAYGWDFGTASSVVNSGDGIMSRRPLLFSVNMPEGLYSVRVRLGGADEATTTSVKAESRRLMLESIHLPAGEVSEYHFLVHTRTPEIAGGGKVRLKAREKPYLQWDQKLTLEFNGQPACIQSIEIRPAAKDTPTLFIAGDSTVCDQPDPPYNSWGQMLTRFFKPDIAIANYAMSGETILSSLASRRFEKLFSEMKTGDTLLMQFGHNDMKNKSPDAKATYRKNLEKIIDKTLQLGATPILVTSMERKIGVKKPTLKGYPQIVREVASSKEVSLIDLNASSKILYAALGANLSAAFVDGSHHNNYGSYQLAKCIVSEIQTKELNLAKHVVDAITEYHPAKPDSIELFRIPTSPQIIDQKKPDGS